MAADGEQVATATEQDNATCAGQEAAVIPNTEASMEEVEGGSTATEQDNATSVGQEASVNSNTVMEKVEGWSNNSVLLPLKNIFSECSGFSTRYLNEKWIGRYDDTGQYMEYHNNEWRPLPEDDLMFIQQLWLEQEAAETQVCIY